MEISSKSGETKSSIRPQVLAYERLIGSKSRWHLICHWFDLMIYMNLKLVPLPARTEPLIHALRLQMSRTQVQPGCIQCRLSQDPADPNVILYQEEWNSWEEIEKHIRSARFSKILELMELSSKSPDLSFADVHELRGMEYVQQLRLTEKT